MSYILLGVITWYVAIASPLRCGGTYTLTEQWIAIGLDDPALARWHCDDLVRVEYGDTVQYLRIRDTGTFWRHCVEQVDGTCLPIIGDLPYHVYAAQGKMSAEGTVVNLRVRDREIMRRERR